MIERKMKKCHWEHFREKDTEAIVKCTQDLNAEACFESLKIFEHMINYAQRAPKGNLDGEICLKFSETFFKGIEKAVNKYTHNLLFNYLKVPLTRSDIIQGFIAKEESNPDRHADIFIQKLTDCVSAKNIDACRTRSDWLISLLSHADEYPLRNAYYLLLDQKIQQLERYRFSKYAQVIPQEDEITVKEVEAVYALLGGNYNTETKKSDIEICQRFGWHNGLKSCPKTKDQMITAQELMRIKGNIVFADKLMRIGQRIDKSIEMLSKIQEESSYFDWVHIKEKK